MTRRRLALALVVFAGLAGSACAGGERASGDGPVRAAAKHRGVRLKLLGRFDSPTYITAPSGDRERRFVVERGGRIRVVRGHRVLPQPFLDISAQVETGGESGLLSMAFAPDYQSSGKFYVYYTDNSGFPTVAEYQRSASDPNRASPGSRRILINQPHQEFNHKGGQLQFGPDGKLYAGLGDGGGHGDPHRNGQNRNTLLGKLLRIDPGAQAGRDYGIPRDNPFVGRGGRDEIYAYGLRNPYRFSFDRRTGDLIVGDVGQDVADEVDFVRNGRGRGHTPPGGYNFGWSIFEGRHRFRAGTAPGHVPPVIQRPLGVGGWCALIGGYVVRDRSVPSLYGRYVYGDNCDPRLRVARLRAGRARGDRQLGLRIPSLSSFGEDARGRVYATSLDGPVYRLASR